MPVPNLALWEEVEKTDPKFTKEYTGPGGFTGTAVNAQYLAKRATEKFGPCGTFKSKVVDRERDLKLIERLAALRDAGVSRIAACRKVGMSDTLLNRLVLDYDFNFPKRWEKRA